MKELQKAIEILKSGGIVVFPTDTTFVIGCRMDNGESIRKLFKLRKRPINQPVLVLVNSLSMAQEYLSPISEDIKDKLVNKYWPGALTIVYPCRKDKVDKLVRGSGETLGVRMPDHPLALDLINGVNVPILGPSANFHGKSTPYAFEELDSKLKQIADFVLPGNTKNLGSASTVVDCSDAPWKVIRQGVIEI